jgi:hypothetical protein
MTGVAGYEETLSSAILEGEAYALDIRGSFRNVRAIVNGLIGIPDLAERVARSFGGGVEDRFIQNRMPGIHFRLARATLPSEPRRGFDALTEALLPIVRATQESDIKYEIARALNAEINDRVVHVLAARIRALLDFFRPSRK